MARTTFARTVIITKCKTKYVDQNNQIHEEWIEIYGDYDLEHAQRAVKRKLNAKGVLVEKVKHKSFYGKISFEKFAELCEKSDYKEW